MKARPAIARILRGIYLDELDIGFEKRKLWCAILGLKLAQGT